MNASRRRAQGRYPLPLMTVAELVDAQVNGDAVRLAHELGRTRDLVYYLVGTIEGIAMRHRDVKSTANKVSALIRE